MTDEEKKQLVDAVITQLKSEGTDVSNANIVSNANGIDYVVAYGKSGQIVRAVPAAISSEKVGASGYMNAYTEAGVYNINTSGGEDLPIDNQGAISARLTVLVTESGGNTVITQVLNLNNNAGGEGNVYIRSCQNGEWKPWGKLQTNVEVGLVDQAKMDDLTDNGIYSGILSTTGETFIIICINNYAIAQQAGVQHISHLKYSLVAVTGEVKIEKRTRDAYGFWTEWETIKGGSNVDDTAITEIKSRAIDADSLNVEQEIDGVRIDFATLDDGAHSGDITIPAATIEKAGVMSAKDKVALDKATTDIKDNADALVTEVEKLKDGDTIVGQAREIHSRNGKTVTDSFLARTTAGSGTIGDGVATLKSVGGNIVKNLVGDFLDKNVGRITLTMQSGIHFASVKRDESAGNVTLKLAIAPTVVGHKYYFSMLAKSSKLLSAFLKEYAANDYLVIRQDVTKYAYLSSIVTETIPRDSILLYLWGYSGTVAADEQAAFSQPLLVDLTEMFGKTKADQMTKEECDKLFGTMDALPQGLNFAKPTEFKSTGFNQFNPDNVLDGKAIVDNSIVSGDKKIAVIPCLPCKVGVGENNGYCIHGGFGEDIKVYLTPLNPMEVEGELYMHELTKDITTDTYVPLIKGYMLVEVPTTANLCAHFLWSEDKCERGTYEPYFESKVELPTIPQMSEWGLAGIQSSGTLACDEIDFVKGVYRKKIKNVELSQHGWWNHKTGMCIYYCDLGKNTNGINNALLCERYSIVKYAANLVDSIPNKCMMFGGARYLYIRDDDYTKNTDFRNSLTGLYAYYAMATPEEYPLPKVDNNYISSDYGVEQFDSIVPCSANNLYYMRSLAGETRNFLDRLYDNTAKTNANEVADYITNGIEGNKELATNAPNLALRAFYIAAGAEYNDSEVDKTKTAPWGETITHKAGHYYLNGLGDITEEQMAKIYSRGWFNSADYAPLALSAANNIRTNIGRAGMANGNYTQGYFAYINNIIEVICCSNDNGYFNLDNPTYLFYGNSRLKAIIGNLWFAKNSTTDFIGCTALQELRVRELSKNMTLSNSPLVSKQSILYMIQKATPTAAIAITLHADAYARLADDADIVTALAAQPLITLVSA